MLMMTKKGFFRGIPCAKAVLQIFSVPMTWLKASMLQKKWTTRYQCAQKWEAVKVALWRV